MAKTFTISELSARSGVSASALRFYERQGLIGAERTNGNQRRYHPATLRRVAFIRVGTAAGISLREIGAALGELPRERTPSARDWARLSRRWRTDLDARISDLQALRDRLSTCIGCGCLSLRTCEMLNPGDEAAQIGSGPRYLHEPGPRETV